MFPGICCFEPLERNAACKGGRRLDIWRSPTLSSSGLGHRPFTAVTRVRIPLGSRVLFIENEPITSACKRDRYWPTKGSNIQIAQPTIARMKAIRNPVTTRLLRLRSRNCAPAIDEPTRKQMPRIINHVRLMRFQRIHLLRSVWANRSAVGCQRLVRSTAIVSFVLFWLGFSLVNA